MLLALMILYPLCASIVNFMNINIMLNSVLSVISIRELFCIWLSCGYYMLIGEGILIHVFNSSCRIINTSFKTT